MEAIYHAFQHWMLCACLAGLGMIAALLFLAKVAAPAWDAVRRWWSLPCIQRVIVGVCVVGLSYYGSTKQGWHIGYDGGIKAGATANVVTNDTVSIYWQRDTSGGIYIPESAAVYIDYRPNTETNAEWGLLAQTTVGAWSWTGTVQNATNYDYSVWGYYIPPEPVHTNGVWTYKTHFDRKGEYALPLRARVEVNGVAIATPAEKRKDAVPTARDYIQDGLVAMWDGIENAGFGIHNASATEAVDLSGNGHTLKFSGNYAIGSDYIYIDGVSGAYGFVEDFSFAAPTTQDMCVSIHAKDVYGRFIGEGRGLCGSNEKGSSRIGYLYGFGVDSRFNINIIPGFDIPFSQSLTVASSTASFFYNGGLKSSMNCINSSYGGTTYIFGRNTTGRGVTGNIHNIRLYSRALTAEEIAHNYKIDKERFNLP